MQKARESASLDFDGATLSFFPDLAREILEHRRALRPLTEKLHAASINYRWGFPAALIANRDGKTAILRFPRERSREVLFGRQYFSTVVARMAGYHYYLLSLNRDGRK